MHRDIKCENVLLETPLAQCKSELQYVAKICDFGFASYCDPVEGMSKRCGTPGYMAPEILAEGV